MLTLKATISNQIKKYWPLIKSLQTGLLLMTGLAGYMSSRCPIFNVTTVLALTGSLFLAISGSTVLNMWYDRDIDALMQRTCMRPLPNGDVSPPEALRFGIVLSVLGIAWSFLIDPLYGAVVFAGLFFDVVVYTIWLKRRTCWSILWGGLSGAMPVLAGRALGVGGLDWVAFALAAGILFWIPTHILTFSMRYHRDYKAAGIPTFASTYGFKTTRLTIAISSIVAACAMIAAAVGIGMSWGYLRMLASLSGILLLLAVYLTVRPSERANFGLFKYASLFMLSAMLMIVLDVL
jgi:heme o synthase